MAPASNTRQWQPGFRALPAGSRSRRLSAFWRGGPGCGGRADWKPRRVPGAVQLLILCPPAHPSILALRRVSRAETSAVHHSTLVMGGVPLMMEMRGAEYPSVLWFIGELHNSFREALCRNEPQCGVFALPEELLTLPHNERMDREIEHVEQVLLQQSLSEKTIAIDEKILSFLLLEPGHFSNHIASNNGRVVPFGYFQLRRENILLYGIDPVGPRVGASGPNLLKSLVCVAAHQHRIARQQLAQSVPQISIVAVLKKSRDVCSCEHAVYRAQGIFDNFPHNILSFHKDVPRSRGSSRFAEPGLISLLHSF